MAQPVSKRGRVFGEISVIEEQNSFLDLKNKGHVREFILGCIM